MLIDNLDSKANGCESGQSISLSKDIVFTDIHPYRETNELQSLDF